MNDLPPLGDELAELFRAERTVDAPPGAVRTRVRAAVRARLGTAPPSSTDASAMAGRASAKAIAKTLGVFVAGGLVGAALMRAATPTPTPPMATAAPSNSISLATTAIVSSAKTASSAIAPPSETIAVRPVPRARPTSEPELDGRSAIAERGLLDGARVALSSGEPARALDIADRHAREYPRGTLAEEREAIAIRALVKLTRYDEARTRATRFHATYPNSLATPAVRAAIGTIP